MNKYILFSLLILFSITGSIAQETDSKKKTVKTSFWVNGLCDMCQTRIQKAALSTKGVKMANWDIESKTLTVLYNQKKCSLMDIKQNIAAVGHDSKDVRATDEAYNNLHMCCFYERE